MVIEYVSSSVFASLVRIHIGIASSEGGLEICAITAGIKNHKPTIKKRKKKHYKIVLLAKTKSNSKEVLICRALF